jgi:hypothetical protein
VVKKVWNAIEAEEKRSKTCISQKNALLQNYFWLNCWKSWKFANFVIWGKFQKFNTARSYTQGE